MGSVTQIIRFKSVEALLNYKCITTTDVPSVDGIESFSLQRHLKCSNPPKTIKLLLRIFSSFPLSFWMTSYLSRVEMYQTWLFPFQQQPKKINVSSRISLTFHPRNKNGQHFTSSVLKINNSALCWLVSNWTSNLTSGHKTSMISIFYQN